MVAINPIEWSFMSQSLHILISTFTLNRIQVIICHRLGVVINYHQLIFTQTHTRTHAHLPRKHWIVCGFGSAKKITLAKSLMSIKWNISASFVVTALIIALLSSYPLCNRYNHVKVFRGRQISKGFNNTEWCIFRTIYRFHRFY